MLDLGSDCCFMAVRNVTKEEEWKVKPTWDEQWNKAVLIFDANGVD